MAWNGPNEACCHSSISSIWASRPNSPRVVEMLNCKGRPHWFLLLMKIIGNCVIYVHSSKLKVYKHEEFEIVSLKLASGHLGHQRNILTIFSDCILKFLSFLRWMHIRRNSLIRTRYKKPAEAVYGRDSTAAGKASNNSVHFYRPSSIKNPRLPMAFFSLDFSSVWKLRTSCTVRATAPWLDSWFFPWREDMTVSKTKARTFC